MTLPNGHGVFDEPLTDAFAHLIGTCSQNEQGNGQTCTSSKCRISHSCSSPDLRIKSIWQEVKSQYEQYEGDDFDHQLGKSQIRRTKKGEQQRQQRTFNA